jgi:hypothetical protein
MFSEIWNACKSLFNRVMAAVKQWAKPANVTLTVGARYAKMSITSRHSRENA